MEVALINDLMYIRKEMMRSLQKNEDEGGDLREQIMALEYHLKILKTAYNSTLDQGDNSQSRKRWDVDDVDMEEDSLVLSKAWGTGKRMLEESTETATTNKKADQRGTSDYKRLYNKALIEEYADRFIKTDGRTKGRPPTAWRGSEEEAKAWEFLAKKREESLNSATQT